MCEVPIRSVRIRAPEIPSLTTVIGLAARTTAFRRSPAVYGTDQEGLQGFDSGCLAADPTGHRFQPLAPAALSCLARPQHQFCGSQSRSKILALQCFEYGFLGIVERAFKPFGCLGPPEQFEVWDCVDRCLARLVAAQGQQGLMRLAAFLPLVSKLGKASDDAGSPQRPCEADASIEASVAPVRRQRFSCAGLLGQFV